MIVALLKGMRGLEDSERKKKLIVELALAITDFELDLSWQNLILEDIKNLCEVLLKNSIVTSLNLSANQISLEGIIILAAFLKQSTTLKELNLQYNKINDEGVAVLISVLKESSLVSLDFRYNKISDQGLITIANAAAVSHSSVGAKHWGLEGKYAYEVQRLFQKAIEMNVSRKALARSVSYMNHLLDAAPVLMHVYRKTFSKKDPNVVKNKKIR